MSNTIEPRIEALATDITETTKKLYELTGGLLSREQVALKIQAAFDIAVPAEEEKPTPIGSCPSCGVPIYTDDGFCGCCGRK